MTTGELRVGMIGRLAEKWATECGEHIDEPIVKKDVRFFVNAIADELDETPGGDQRTADWLRSQASEGGGE